MWNAIAGPINLPTQWGNIRIFGFTDISRGVTQLALVMGSHFEKDVLVRVQSACIFGEVFGGLDCDCRPQLDKSLQLMQQSGGGILIYLAQEGRGAGLHSKIAAMKLQQDLGIDTVDAYHKLGLSADSRFYGDAATILKHLGITHVKLLTNSPHKEQFLSAEGIHIAEVIPLQTTVTRHNLPELITKLTKLGHKLNLDSLRVGQFHIAETSEDVSLQTVEQTIQLATSGNTLNTEDILPPLALFSLYAIGSPNKESLHSLSSLANRVWTLATALGQFVVKEFVTLNTPQIARIHQVQDKLRVNGVNIPNIIRNRFGHSMTPIDGRLFEICEHIPHMPMRYPEMNISTPVLQEAAHVLALLHETPTADVDQLLRTFDLSTVNLSVAKLVKEFLGDYDRMLDEVAEDVSAKLSIVHEFLLTTSDKRNSILSADKVLSLSDIVITHGDFSLSNLLLSADDGELYIVDWDDVALRPRAWEVQRALALLCGMGKCNANLDAIDYDRAKLFLLAYFERSPLSTDHFKQMIEVANYNYSVSWLEFTLSKILQHDFRVLELIPANLEDALFWESNIENYEKFLLSFLHDRF